MHLFPLLAIALRSLRRNKVRTALTSLGIVIGIASVIAMVGIGQGARSQIEQQISSLGDNLVMVFPGSSRETGGMRTGSGGATTLVPEDGEAIAAEIPGVRAVTPELRVRRQVIGNGVNWNTMVIGGSEDYLEVRNWRIARGGMFSEAQVRSLAKVAVVGQTLVDTLFPEGDAIGRTLRIGSEPFTIIGVLGKKGFNLFGQDQDDTILVPYTIHLRRIARRNNVSTLIVQTASRENLEDTTLLISDLLRYRHGIPPDGQPDFTVRGQDELVARATATTETMTALLAGVAAISLLVGGIGIMNIMLVSVTERTREIGIRLALGAHASAVLKQFLVEALIAGLIGGAIGVLAGVGLSQAVGALQGWPIHVSWPAVVGSVAFSAGIGIFFGIYPARKAAALDPIEALRYE